MPVITFAMAGSLDRDVRERLARDITAALSAELDVPQEKIQMFFGFGIPVDGTIVVVQLVETALRTHDEIARAVRETAEAALRGRGTQVMVNVTMYPAECTARGGKLRSAPAAATTPEGNAGA